MCWRWELFTIGPGVIAWVLVLVTAVLTLVDRANWLARAGAISSLTIGLLTFAIAVGLGVGCRATAWYLPERPSDSVRSLREKLQLGAPMGALPALGGASLLMLTVLRSRKAR